MHVAITLSKELIQYIKIGRKRIELRKRVPAFFDRYKEYIAVVEKGSNRCPLLLTISSFEYISASEIRKRLSYWAYKLCVSELWLENYLIGEDTLFLWRIQYAREAPYPEKTYRKLSLKRNPQSYVYIKNKNL